MAAASKTKPAASGTKAKANGGGSPDLILEALKAIRALSGVEVIEKKGYFRVAKGGQTVGYLNGNRKLRMDFAAGNSGYDAVSATDASGVATIVDRIKSFTPKPKADKPKATAKGKATTKKASTSKAKGGASAKATAQPGDDVEVNPDPK